MCDPTYLYNTIPKRIFLLGCIILEKNRSWSTSKKRNPWKAQRKPKRRRKGRNLELTKFKTSRVAESLSNEQNIRHSIANLVSENHGFVITLENCLILFYRKLMKCLKKRDYAEILIQRKSVSHQTPFLNVRFQAPTVYHLVIRQLHSSPLFLSHELTARSKNAVGQKRAVNRYDTPRST